MTNPTPAPAPKEMGLYEKHAQTILMAIATSAIIGCFTFLWNLNKTVTQIQGDNDKRTIRIDQVQQSVNALQLDMKDTKATVQDVRERMIRVEVSQK
jgi:septal ring factor EnvC (AmiA/AmiB activator)